MCISNKNWDFTYVGDSQTLTLIDLPDVTLEVMNNALHVGNKKSRDLVRISLEDLNNMLLDYHQKRMIEIEKFLKLKPQLAAKRERIFKELNEREKSKETENSGNHRRN